MRKHDRGKISFWSKHKLWLILAGIVVIWYILYITRNYSTPVYEVNYSAADEDRCIKSGGTYRGFENGDSLNYGCVGR